MTPKKEYSKYKYIHAHTQAPMHTHILYVMETAVTGVTGVTNKIQITEFQLIK